MDIHGLIASLKSQRDSATEQRQDHVEHIEYALDNVKREGRRGFNDAERSDVDWRKKQVGKLAKDIAELDTRLSEAEKVRSEEAELERLNAIRVPGAIPPAYDRVARIGMETRTYRPDNWERDVNFFADVANNFHYRDVNASERLSRHMQEETVERARYMQRAVGTGAFSGLVVPQYLTDMVARRAQAWKPLAVNMNTHRLPESGMTVNISRITTGSATAVQTTENSAVAESNMDDTLLTEDILTIAGQQTMSRQALERGSLTEETVIDDLMRSLATTLDAQLITRATIGLKNLAQNFTYTDASPTAAELWPKLIQGVNSIETTLLNIAPATHVVMHPRRWHWFTSNLSSTWPIIADPNVPSSTLGIRVTNEYGPSVRGVLPNGLKVIVDGNIETNLGAGTNEDEVYIIAQDEAHLWEDPNQPVMIRAEQPAAASLGVLFVVYQWAAWTWRRYPGGHAKVSGSGMTSPVF